MHTKLHNNRKHSRSQVPNPISSFFECIIFAVIHLCPTCRLSFTNVVFLLLVAKTTNSLPLIGIKCEWCTQQTNSPFSLILDPAYSIWQQIYFGNIERRFFTFLLQTLVYSGKQHEDGKKESKCHTMWRTQTTLLARVKFIYIDFYAIILIIPLFIDLKKNATLYLDEKVFFTVERPFECWAEKYIVFLKWEIVFWMSRYQK